MERRRLGDWMQAIVRALILLVVVKPSCEIHLGFGIQFIGVVFNLSDGYSSSQ